MKTILSTVIVAIMASAHALGWVIDKPIDYADQLKKSNFTGIVEVTSVVATGEKKLMSGYNVLFRELRLELKILSVFKGHGEKLTCKIYRVPTEEELLADGVTNIDVLKILLNLGSDESLHLFPAHVRKGANLVVYLRADGSEYFPVSGDLDSSRSLLSLKPSNLINSIPIIQEVQQDATSNGDKPSN
jgi:hypothetical protein